jgi:hypothetical protein
MFNPKQHETAHCLDWRSWSRVIIRHTKGTSSHPCMMGVCWDASSAALAAGICHSGLATRGGKDGMAGKHDALIGSWQSECTGFSESEVMGLMRQSQGAPLAASFAKVLLRQLVWTALDSSSGSSSRSHSETMDRFDTCSSAS